MERLNSRLAQDAQKTKAAVASAVTSLQAVPAVSSDRQQWRPSAGASTAGESSGKPDMDTRDDKAAPIVAFSNDTSLPLESFVASEDAIRFGDQDIDHGAWDNVGFVGFDMKPSTASSGCECVPRGLVADSLLSLSLTWNDDLQTPRTPFPRPQIASMPPGTCLIRYSGSRAT